MWFHLFSSLLLLLCSDLGVIRGCNASVHVQANHRSEALDTAWKQHHSNSSILDIVQARGYLRVGTTGDYRPFSLVNPNITNATNRYIGADIDHAQSLSTALALQHPIRFVPTSFANLSQDLIANRFDIAMSGISITTPRALRHFYSVPYQTVGQAACVRCSELSKFGSGLQSIDQSGVRVGVNTGGENERFDRANLKYATLVVVQKNTDLYKALLNGMADVVISDMIEVTLESNLSNGTLCVANPGRPFNFVEKGYLMNRDVAWKEFVDVWLRIQVQSGAWNTTLTKWLNYQWGSV